MALGRPSAGGPATRTALPRRAICGPMRAWKRVVTAVYASRGKSFWSRFASTVERTEFERLLRDSDRSRRALFDAAMRAFAQGRPVAGDKTPEHIDAVPTLLSWFPEARVVHTFRDPRAIYVSLRRKERAESLSEVGRIARRAGPLFDLYASTSLALRWRSMARRHRRYAAAYPGRYMLQRFEDLAGRPRGSREAPVRVHRYRVRPGNARTGGSQLELRAQEVRSRDRSIHRRALARPSAEDNRALAFAALRARARDVRLRTLTSRH